MDFKEVMSIFNEMVEGERKLLEVKNKDYVVGDDKLWNFKFQANMQMVEPEDIVLTFLMKHLTSVIRAIKTKEYNLEWKNDYGEGLKQHISDARNYLLLLYCVLKEKEK